MPDDVRDRLLEAARAADAVARRFGSAVRASAVPHTGTDATGAVTVHLGPDARTDTVVVDPDWRSALRADDMAPAVLAAVESATAARLESFHTALSELDRKGPPEPRPIEPPAPDPATLPTLLAAAEASLAELTRDLAANAAAVHQGRSRAGHARATVSNTGELHGIEYDLRWLVGAGGHAIGLETTEAVRAAVREADAHAERRRVTFSPLAELSATVLDTAASDDPADGRRKE